MATEKLYHSVTLDSSRCKGCTACLKNCPTEAIRIRDGKAVITKELCIDCGECIKTCPYHAKQAVTDSFDALKRFSFNIALPAPALYGQFHNLKDADVVLNGLKKIGFDAVYETAKGTEPVTAYAKKMLDTGKLKKPVINSACPAVVRLITVRFPGLIDHILPIIAPMESAAIAARRRFARQTGLPPEKIGVFFISPCATKATTVISPIGIEKSPVDGVLSIQTVYMKLLSALSATETPVPISESTMEGISWARTGGELKALGVKKSLAVDGISNIIPLFEAIEDDENLDIDFIEALSCAGGCVNGPLTVENGYVAKMRIVDIAKHQHDKHLPHTPVEISEEELGWRVPVEYRNILPLDADLTGALEKMEQIRRIYERLPQVDCGSCGAPTCKCLAEDIVRGVADENDCIYRLREEYRKMLQDRMCTYSEGEL